MKILRFLLLALGSVGALAAADGIVLPVDSPAFVFSPGNWVGDAGRGGATFRQTWNTGAYFRVSWETTSATPEAKLRFDTSTYGPEFTPPRIVYSIDGVWRSKIPCADEIVIEELTGAGPHELVVYLSQSDQVERWGTAEQSGRNVVRVSGLYVDAGATPRKAAPGRRWALIVGDSITEGVGTTELAVYSHLVGQGLRTQGFEYGISACGFSGWINRGDKPPGDVPGYYVVRDSVEGTGGRYDDAASRWNKIDGHGHSLLDARGRLSAYGGTGQEPALVLINYGTNDELHHSDRSETRASMVQGLAALRRSAPDAWIVLIIPFGQYYAAELKQAVERHRQAHPRDRKVAIIDFGPDIARALATKKGLLGGLHPNDRGHAHFAASILAQLMPLLTSGSK